MLFDMFYNVYYELRDKIETHTKTERLKLILFPKTVKPAKEDDRPTKTANFLHKSFKSFVPMT